jgi:hypothetical protein
LNSDPDSDPAPDLDTVLLTKNKKIQQIFFSFFDQKLQKNTSIKDVQDAREAFSPYPFRLEKYLKMKF